MNNRGKWSLSHWLVISLILHACVILPFAFISLHTLQHTHTKLLIELFGMISNRQQEEIKGGGAPLPKKVILQRPAAPQKVKKPDPERIPDTPKAPPPDTPAYVEKTDTIPDPEGQAGPPASAVFVPASGSGGIGQRGLSIGRRGQGTNKTMEYLARLSRRLQANLVYPREARKGGIEGIATIAFTITESGNIKEGSLRVQKSSGHAALDSHAMKSALDSEPFEKPPKELKVAIAVSFTVEMTRPRSRTAVR